MDQGPTRFFSRSFWRSKNCHISHFLVIQIFEKSTYFHFYISTLDSFITSHIIKCLYGHSHLNRLTDGIRADDSSPRWEKNITPHIENTVFIWVLTSFNVIAFFFWLLAIICLIFLQWSEIFGIHQMIDGNLNVHKMAAWININSHWVNFELPKQSSIEVYAQI